MRETLNLDAALNGGSGGDVEAVIARLGLAQCADTFVGGDTGGGKVVAGISGGERRRLAIAAETLCLRHARCGDGTAAGEVAARGSGGIILADEPTTGLDSHQADKIVDVLGKTAREESAVVVCVLHQPRSAIFEKLDDLMLLASGGRVAYIGKAMRVESRAKQNAERKLTRAKVTYIPASPALLSRNKRRAAPLHQIERCMSTMSRGVAKMSNAAQDNTARPCGGTSSSVCAPCPRVNGRRVKPMPFTRVN